MTPLSTRQLAFVAIAFRGLFCSQNYGHGVSAFSPTSSKSTATSNSRIFMGSGGDGGDFWSSIIDSKSSDSFHEPQPQSVDSVLDQTTPNFSSDRPTLFRERHGWCPYSERCWLALELAGVEYDTIRIDNTGGPRPSYYSGQTPQMKWEDGREQGESMDLVNEIDQKYANGKFQSSSSEAQSIVKQFSNIFPRARPSSRAAYLFQYNGEPLWKSVFEETLQDTDNLLSETDGPYFCGSELTVADIAWAPFLERYRYQLPCLHDGLNPACRDTYPNLSNWFQAMDTKVPAYACRVKGDGSSWRKVLSMAGFGNAGIPPQVQSNMDNIIEKEEKEATDGIDLDIWTEYSSTRPYVASTPYLEVVSILARNRQALVNDIVKQSAMPKYKHFGLPASTEEADKALQEMANLLVELSDGTTDEYSMQGSEEARIIATFLDERMCVPRDMGSMAAATIKNLAVIQRR